LHAHVEEDRRFMTNLPTALEHEPLVDAVFEVRVGGGHRYLADLLPGLLFGLLDPKPAIARLPAAEIPRPIRESDPNLAFAPITRLDWRHVTISFGSRNVVVGCKMPYPKWPSFKEAILDIVDKIARANIVAPIDRYSIKYVNVIRATTQAEQISKINLSVRVGDVEAKDDHLSVQVHRKEGDILHILSVITGAQGQMPDGKKIVGAVVDIDSIRSIQFPDFATFSAQLAPAVESLRQANKVKFFSCLTQSTIDEMGPKYD